MAAFDYFGKPKTIYDCAAFICLLNFLLGCSGFVKWGPQFVLNKWTRIYSLGGAAFMIGALSTSLYIQLANNQRRERILDQDKLALSIFGLELVISTFVFITTVLSMQVTARQHMGLYKRFATLDKQLIHNFGVNLNYHKLLWKNVITLVTVSFIYLAALYAAVGKVADGDVVSAMVGVWFYAMITGGPHICGYIHMNLAEILSIRFRLLQHIIEPNYLNYNFPAEHVRIQRLEEIVALVKDLHGIIKDINEIYKLSLSTSIAHDFSLSTSELYIICGRSLDGSISYTLLAFVGLCMLPPFYKIMVEPIYCDHTVKEARKCLRLLEMLDNWYPNNAAVTQIVSSMMRWRYAHKIEFTSSWNFVYNKTMITVYATVVFNYLLILIQFHMTQKMGEQIEQQKVALQEWISM